MTVKNLKVRRPRFDDTAAFRVRRQWGSLEEEAVVEKSVSPVEEL